MKKRADGRYAKQVTVGIKNGKPVKKTVYGKTIKELERNYRELMLLIDRGIILDNQGITVTELMKEWYRIKKEGKVKRNTECAYSSIMKRIENSIGDMKVKDVTLYTVESLVTDIQKENLYKTSQSVLSMLYSIFDYAIHNNIVAINPCKGLSVKYDKKEKRILTEEEKIIINNITDELSEKEKVILLIMRYTGMRRGEIFSLTKSDIDKKTMTIQVNKTLIDNNGKPYVQDSTKTKSGSRHVPIFLPLAKPLFNYIGTLDKEYLFLNKNNNFYAVNSMNFLFKQIIKKLGLGEDLSTHCFRYNFITECYTAGIDVKKLQMWVGHTDISTTLNIYTKLARETIQDGSEMDKFYGSQTEVKQKSRKSKIS